MASYCSKFIPDFATLTYPLRVLTKKNSTWQWSKEQDDALTKLKLLLTEDKVLSYFDPTKQTELIVDASPVGLGAILTQHHAPNEPRVIDRSQASGAYLEQPKIKASSTHRTMGPQTATVQLYGNPQTWEGQSSRLHVSSPRPHLTYHQQPTGQGS